MDWRGICICSEITIFCSYALFIIRYKARLFIICIKFVTWGSSFIGGGSRSDFGASGVTVLEATIHSAPSTCRVRISVEQVSDGTIQSRVHSDGYPTEPEIGGVVILCFQKRRFMVI